MNRDTLNMLDQLRSTGISLDDAMALRRISMTLHRWHEDECNGDIQRDETTGVAYRHYGHDTPGPYQTVRIADREAGAIKRLAKIMVRYPALSTYIQTDPRGASLYILRPGDVPEGKDADAYYSRGLAVYK